MSHENGAPSGAIEEELRGLNGRVGARLSLKLLAEGSPLSSCPSPGPSALCLLGTLVQLPSLPAPNPEMEPGSCPPERTAHSSGTRADASPLSSSSTGCPVGGTGDPWARAETPAVVPQPQVVWLSVGGCLNNTQAV